MNKHWTIYFKALVLLTVFSLNMVVSVACSVSNSIHNSHHSGKGTGSHSHEHKGKHKHSTHSDHKHTHDPDHKHNNNPDHRHSHNNNDENQQNEDDNCCSSDVIKLQQSDRSVARTIDLPEQTTLLVEYDLLLGIDKFLFTVASNNILPQHLRWPPATIPDIRIAIQSFQI